MRFTFVALGLAVLNNHLGTSYALTIAERAVAEARYPAYNDGDIGVLHADRDIGIDQVDGSPLSKRDSDDILDKVIDNAISANDKRKEQPYPGQKPPQKMDKTKLKLFKPILVKPGAKAPVVKLKVPKQGVKAKPLPKVPPPKDLDEALYGLDKGEKPVMVKPVEKPKKEDKKKDDSKPEQKREVGEVAKRMSGDQFAIPIATWISIFQRIDDILARDRNIRHPVIINVMGGVSSLALGSRGPAGVTEDCDFFFTDGTSSAIQTALRNAIAAVYSVNTHLLAPDYMNTAIEHFIPSGSRRWISRRSNRLIYHGTRLWVAHGHFGVNLAGKMDKIRKELRRTGMISQKNLQDGVALAQQAVAQKGGVPVSWNDLREWSRHFGKDRKTAKENVKVAAGNILYSLLQISPHEKVFDQTVLDIIEASSSSGGSD